MVQPSSVPHYTDASAQSELSASAGAKFGDDFENPDAGHLRASTAPESTLPFVAVSTDGSLACAFLPSSRGGAQVQ